MLQLLLAVFLGADAAASGESTGSTELCSNNGFVSLMLAVVFVLVVATLAPLYCGHELCLYNTLVLHVEWQLVLHKA